MWKRNSKNKFGAVKSFKHGRWWPSKLELAVYEILLLLEKGKKLSDIKCQVTVRFHTHDHGKVVMIPDFSAFDPILGQTIYIEAKGMKTRVWMRKKKAWAIAGPGLLHIYEGSWKYPKLTETIVPKGAE